ncbi:MAG: hypothetical protein AAGF10_02340 [Verrucomicrobiota bacterium]
MEKKKSAKRKATSWHNIKQSSAGRAVTTIARKRKLTLGLKAYGLIAAALALLAVVGGGIYFLNKKPSTLLTTSTTQPLRQVYFETDGVLTQAWLTERLDIPTGVRLSDVDIAGLRRDLLAAGQVSEVRVAKHYPDALVVQLHERVPLVKLVIRDAAGRKGLRLVDKQGVVYHGEHYAIDYLAQLPFVVVGEVIPEGDGFEPIVGMNKVAELLQTVWREYPSLYPDWQYISLNDYEPAMEGLGATIRVQTHGGEQLVFEPGHFAEQLGRLELILTDEEVQSLPRIARIDLSYQEPVIQLAEVRRPTRYRR